MSSPTHRASIGRHSNELTKKILDLGAFQAIRHCLEIPNTELNIEAMNAVRLLGTHNSFAEEIVQADIGDLINKCLYTPDNTLIEWTLFAVGDIVCENMELADYIASVGLLEVIKNEVLKSSIINKKGFKVCILHLWSCFATHSTELSKAVVDSGALPFIKTSLQMGCANVRENALNCLIQIAKNDATLAVRILEQNILDTLLYIADKVCVDEGCMCLDLVGIIASTSVQAATNIAEHPICRAMTSYVKNVKPKDSETDLLNCCIWALGQIGKHSAELANKLTQIRVIRAIINIYQSQNLSLKLYETCRSTLEELLLKCTNIHVLDYFIFDVPEDIQEYVIRGLANLVTTYKTAKTALLECGGLLKVVYVPITPGTNLMDDVLRIIHSYPDTIITRLRDGPPQEPQPAEIDPVDQPKESTKTGKRRSMSRRPTKSIT